MTNRKRSGNETLLRSALFVISVVFISGCYPTAAGFKPGHDRKAFAKDEYECERDARSVRGDSCTQIGIYEKCMRSKGYEEIPGSADKALCAHGF